ncbi:class I poly(R)-hydroxyalkanoic acid synthase [Sphingomonas sp. BIUV-7]|uniref:Class I poly(R)-hydroxyalkanoic acid synthase n=1 Tax=Sphingomonas natans TaxID=3063330 RepID=A0ABT8YET9_9SPHN|nr:alpha/beta fold hydrolase [Sphingomonas sp. BIUV-7]MDO6416854.1 class I poly(R)-hydroxyalkanoic acid synthase [Sphingomonas sp. BIUV-7]
MAKPGNEPHDGGALLAEMAHWTGVIGKAQQLLMEHGASAALKAGDDFMAQMGQMPVMDPAGMAAAPAAMWAETLGFWRSMLPETEGAAPDRRFAAPDWQEPLFDLIRQTYAVAADQFLSIIDQAPGLSPHQAEQLRFGARNFVEAMSPSNFAFTNPQVVAKIVETRGQNLITGLQRMIEDASSGQLRHVGKDAFELGRNIAMTPGKVVYEAPLFQLIQYSPTTEQVSEIPLIIFPPWFNRFYILDLSPEKSLVQWAVDQGLTVFIVSWKSADASIAHVLMDDYVLNGEWEAIEVVTRLLDVPKTHVVGYCVAGTALSMMLAWAHATGNEAKIASATFFTAQVDFTESGDLSLFVDDAQLKLMGTMAKDGVFDGRYMAMTFNLLRSRDLIWNYVVNNYLLAEDYKSFDLLHWNGDVTNLPAGWQLRYLTELYRDNLLVKPGALSVAGTPIDLTIVKTPAYIQAGREDHIAPAKSVWKMLHHFGGPMRFVLAGSGHIAGVVNHPSANKYQYWTNEAKVDTLDDFVAGATEHKGSWWPDWLKWLSAHDAAKVPAEGARIPGGGALPAIEDAPGRYARTR